MRPAVEIGWRVASAHWNQGYATEAANAVLAWGFNELNFNEIIAMTYDPADDFHNPHPSLKDSWLAPHLLYRLQRESHSQR